MEGVFCLCVCQQIELETLYKLHSLTITLLTQLKKMHMRPQKQPMDWETWKTQWLVNALFVILSQRVFTSGAIYFQLLLNLILLKHCVSVHGQFNAIECMLYFITMGTWYLIDLNVIPCDTLCFLCSMWKTVGYCKTVTTTWQPTRYFACDRAGEWRQFHEAIYVILHPSLDAL